MKEIYIEKRDRSDTERYVAVNGRRMIIKCGTRVEVPEEFAEVIEHSRLQDKVADEFIAEMRMTD